MSIELKQAAQQALDVMTRSLPCVINVGFKNDQKAAIEALRTAIQQAESGHSRLPGVLKDHQIADMVNSLRDIALQFHGHGSLRERIANVLVPALKAEAKTDEMDQMFVKGALSGIVDAQVRDLWPTKQAQKGD